MERPVVLDTSVIVKWFRQADRHIRDRPQQAQSSVGSGDPTRATEEIMSK